MYNKVVWKYFLVLCEVQIPDGNYLIVLRRKRMFTETKYKSIYSVDTDKIQFNLANKARRKASTEPRDPSQQAALWVPGTSLNMHRFYLFQEIRRYKQGTPGQHLLYSGASLQSFQSSCVNFSVEDTLTISRKTCQSGDLKQDIWYAFCIYVNILIQNYTDSEVYRYL